MPVATLTFIFTFSFSMIVVYSSAVNALSCYVCVHIDGSENVTVTGGVITSPKCKNPPASDLRNYTALTLPKANVRDNFVPQDGYTVACMKLTGTLPAFLTVKPRELIWRRHLLLQPTGAFRYECFDKIPPSIKRMLRQNLVDSTFMRLGTSSRICFCNKDGCNGPPNQNSTSSSASIPIWILILSSTVFSLLLY